MEDSQFIVALTVSQFVLNFLRRVTITLQSKECNLVDACNDVALARECIRDSRNELCWDGVWNRIERLSSTVGIVIQKPRSTRIQCHRASAGQSCSDYYRINVYYPFVDHVIKELETRFSNDHEGLVTAQYLVPFYLLHLSQDKVDAISDYYGKFLSYEESQDGHNEMEKAIKECQYKSSLRQLLWQSLNVALKPFLHCTKYSQFF